MSKVKPKFNAEKFFLALADQNRLRLLSLMGDDEICVCYFVEVLQMPQPKVSRHLAYLRRAGIVSARRDGKWIHYRIVPPQEPEIARIFTDIRQWLATHPDMQKDRRRLLHVCCAPVMPIALQGAPKPVSTLGA